MTTNRESVYTIIYYLGCDGFEGFKAGSAEYAACGWSSENAWREKDLPKIEICPKCNKPTRVRSLWMSVYKDAILCGQPHRTEEEKIWSEAFQKVWDGNSDSYGQAVEETNKIITSMEESKE